MIFIFIICECNHIRGTMIIKKKCSENYSSIKKCSKNYNSIKNEPFSGYKSGCVKLNRKKYCYFIPGL